MCALGRRSMGRGGLDGTVHSGAAFCIMKAPIPRNGTFRTNTQTETTRGYASGCLLYTSIQRNNERDVGSRSGGGRRERGDHACDDRNGSLADVHDVLLPVRCFVGCGSGSGPASAFLIMPVLMSAGLSPTAEISARDASRLCGRILWHAFEDDRAAPLYFSRRMVLTPWLISRPNFCSIAIPETSVSRQPFLPQEQMISQCFAFSL